MPKSLCFAEVHNDFKATFDVHIYSVPPEDRIEDAINHLAGRWARLNFLVTTVPAVTSF